MRTKNVNHRFAHRQRYETCVVSHAPSVALEAQRAHSKPCQILEDGDSFQTQRLKYVLFGAKPAKGRWQTPGL